MLSKKSKAIGFIIMSAFGFAMMAAFVRLAGDLPFTQKTFFRNLVAVAVAAVVEVVMVLINRFYINTRVSELNAKIVLYYVLTALPFVGAALFVILLVVAVRMRRYREGRNPSGGDGLRIFVHGRVRPSDAEL